MTSAHPILGVIPARGGSKGLPRKNVRLLAGLPLIAHTVRFAAMCPELDRAIVSTDDDEIAAAARAAGGDVPFRRPSDLAADDTPMLPVLQHALAAAEREAGAPYGSVLLLDPTSPGRIPADVTTAVGLLESEPACEGVIGVSEPDFNPLWHCVTMQDGWLEDLFPDARRFTRRQHVPPVYRITGTLYLWRRDFVATTDNWRDGRFRGHVIPDERAVHIDTPEQFRLVELLLEAGMLEFPWLAPPGARS